MSPLTNAEQGKTVTSLSIKGDETVHKRVTRLSPEPFEFNPSKNPLNFSPAASRSGSEARARDRLGPEIKNARQEHRDALPLESLKANTRSRAQWSNLVAERIRELANNWDLGLSAEERARADEFIKRSDFS